MYRVLVVDDEPFITDGINRFLLNVKNINMDIYKAYSAEEAIDWLNRAKIDIVVSDIQMPGISGLQLAKDIHKKWPLCKVIFLTGYNEFQYAYTAMQYGVSSYILKSEGDEAILVAIEKAIDQIEKNVISEELLRKANENLNISQPLLQKEYLLDILQGEKSSPSIRQQSFDELLIPLNAEFPVILLGGKIDNYSPELTPHERAMYLSGIEVVFNEYLGYSINSTYITWNRRFILWLIQPLSISVAVDKFDLWTNSILFIKGTLESVQETCKKSLGISISLVLDNYPSEWNQVEERYYSMKQIVNYQMDAGIEMALTDKDFYHNGKQDILDKDLSNQMMQNSLEKLKLLETYLESGQSKEFFEILSDEIEHMSKYGQEDQFFRIEMYHSISLIFLSYINRSNMKEVIEAEIGLDKLAVSMELIFQNDTFDYFFKLGERIFQYQKNQQKQKYDTLIIKLHSYIREHVGGDLSLVTLSEKVYLNPAYLSRLYKKVTGRNLSEYISDTRLNKAKKLLQKNDMKIHEIAVYVGYASAAHFSRIFKSTTNMTPQEFRDKMNIGSKII